MKTYKLDKLAENIQQLEKDSMILETLEQKMDQRNKEYLRSTTINELETALMVIEFHAQRQRITSELYVFAKPADHRALGVIQKYSFQVQQASQLDLIKNCEPQTLLNKKYRLTPYPNFQERAKTVLESMRKGSLEEFTTKSASEILWTIMEEEPQRSALNQN